MSGRLSAINLSGLAISENGKRAVKVTGQGTEAIELGQELARKAIQQGADEILKPSTVP
jgi:porphobilinogen deaminase